MLWEGRRAGVLPDQTATLCGVMCQFRTEGAARLLTKSFLHRVMNFLRLYCIFCDALTCIALIFNNFVGMIDLEYLIRRVLPSGALTAIGPNP